MLVNMIFLLSVYFNLLIVLSFEWLFSCLCNYSLVMMSVMWLTMFCFCFFYHNTLQFYINCLTLINIHVIMTNITIIQIYRFLKIHINIFFLWFVAINVFFILKWKKNRSVNFTFINLFCLYRNKMEYVIFVKLLSFMYIHLNYYFRVFCL